MNLSMSFNKESEQDGSIAEEEYKPDTAQLLSDAEKKLRLMLSTAENLPESNRYLVSVGYPGMDYPLRPNTSGQDMEK